MAQDREFVNPVKVVRNKLRLSHAELAIRYGVSESTLLRTEQGLYVDIPPTILRNIATDHPLPSLISADYHRFQVSQRDRNRNELRPYGTIKHDPYSKTHPFISWRKECGIESRLEFCRMFCIHPSTLKRFEDGISLTTPSYLLDVLRSLGVDYTLLEDNYLIWRWVRNRAA